MTRVRHCVHPMPSRISHNGPHGVPLMITCRVAGVGASVVSVSDRGMSVGHPLRSHPEGPLGDAGYLGRASTARIDIHRDARMGKPHTPGRVCGPIAVARGHNLYVAARPDRSRPRMAPGSREPMPGRHRPKASIATSLPVKVSMASGSVAGIRGTSVA